MNSNVRSKLEKLIIKVDDYIRNESVVQVTFICYMLDDDEELRISKMIDKVEGKKTKWYLNQAFTQCKQEIKNWVKNLDVKPSIVGEQYTFSLSDFSD